MVTEHSKLNKKAKWTAIQTQVLSCSYETYAFLITNRLHKRIWLTRNLLASFSTFKKIALAAPQPKRIQDTALMEIATTSYNQCNWAMINRCRLYLQVLKMLDLIQYDINPPNLKNGQRM